MIGIDVSRWQGRIDWQAVRKSGLVDFSGIRATIGGVYTDPRFLENWRGCWSVGIPVIPYHVVRHDVDPAEQLGNLMQVLDEVEPEVDSLLVALDVELPVGDVSGGQLTLMHAHSMVRGLLEIEGLHPAIYTGAWWWDPVVAHYREDLGWARTCPLWVASYTEEPRMPSRPWAAWSFWQYTNSGQVPGITGPVDLNQFDGSSDDLGAWVGEPREPRELRRYSIVVSGTDLDVRWVQEA